MYLNIVKIPTVCSHGQGGVCAAVERETPLTCFAVRTVVSRSARNFATEILHSCTIHAGKFGDPERIPCPGHRMSSDTRAPIWPPRNVNYKRTRFRAPSGGTSAPGPSSARSRGGGGRGLTAFTLARDVRSRPLPRQSRRTQLISSARPIRNHCLGAPAAGEGQGART